MYDLNCSLEMLRYTHWIKCPQKNLARHTWSCKDTYKECRNIQMGQGNKGMWKTQQFYGICPYLMLFEAWVAISSFLACYSLLPPRVTTIFFWNNNAPWNRNVYTAVGEKDLKIGKMLPKRKDVKRASHSWEDWALLETVWQTSEEPHIRKKHRIPNWGFTLCNTSRVYGCVLGSARLL